MPGRGIFVASFPLNILMVHSPKLITVTSNHHQAYVGFTLGEAIRFGSLEFIVDRFSNPSLSPEAVFMGVAHSGSLHYTLSSRNPLMRMTQSRVDWETSISISLEGATW
jgi:hypothetical protein